MSSRSRNQYWMRSLSRGCPRLCWERDRIVRRADAREGPQNGWWLVAARHLEGFEDPISDACSNRELRDQFLGARRERTESRCEVVARGSSCARGGEKEDRGMSSVNYGVVCREFECIASAFGGRFDDSIALVFSGASSAAFADNSSARVFGIATLCSATSWSLRVVVEDRLGDCNRAAEEDSAAAVDEQRPADSVATESSPAVAATRTAAIDGFCARNGMQEGVECPPRPDRRGADTFTRCPLKLVNLSRPSPSLMQAQASESHAIPSAFTAFASASSESVGIMRIDLGIAGQPTYTAARLLVSLALCMSLYHHPQQFQLVNAPARSSEPPALDPRCRFLRHHSRRGANTDNSAFANRRGAAEAPATGSSIALPLFSPQIFLRDDRWLAALVLQSPALAMRRRRNVHRGASAMVSLVPADSLKVTRPEYPVARSVKHGIARSWISRAMG
ncbi:hypothetical protein B0H13DRAFT_2373813 [Mycena leptocephala]|nr:hypothetical protein B0H13DRAFT_2373813 [Mycena leptocephala]